MPLTIPPQIQIGDDPTWHDTEWDPEPPPAMSLGVTLWPGSVKYAHWSVQIDDETPRPFRLLLAHPGSPRDGAVTVPAHGGPAVYRVLSAPEEITGDAGTIWLGHP